MKQMKKAFFILIAVCLFSNSFPTSTFAKETRPIEYIYRDLSPSFVEAVQTCWNCLAFYNVYDYRAGKFYGKKAVRKQEAIQVLDNLYGRWITNQVFTAKQRISKKKVTQGWFCKALRKVTKLVGSEYWVNVENESAILTRYLLANYLVFAFEEGARPIFVFTKVTSDSYEF